MSKKWVLISNKFQDELDDISVKQGFIHRPQIQDEYGSALNATLNASKVRL